MQKIGRNDPCPCGSGKKYKKCCLVRSWTPPGREEFIKSKLLQEILAFVRRNYRNRIDDAYDYFWDDFDPEEYLDAYSFSLADINFWEWLVHDWEPEEDNGKTPIELYMESARGLGPEDKKVLLRMNDAVISLYEVQEVFPEEGLLLKDLLLGGECYVRERAATRSLRRWDIFATRLLRLDDNIIMSGCIYPYSRTHKEPMINYLKKCFNSYRKDFPESTMREFLKRCSDVFNYCWYENIRRPFRPILMTTSGESMVFSHALFTVNDKDSVLDGLGKMDELDEGEGGVFNWLDAEKEDGTATILGVIRIEGSTLRLECNSRERLEQGKAILMERLGGLIIHETDTFQDPYQAIKDMPKPSRKDDSGIPKELEQMLYDQFMRRHYENWLNEKIPALGGKTPLEAVKRPWGKKKVAELLKSIENSEEHRKADGMPWFDTSWLWKRLGLER